MGRCMAQPRIRDFVTFLTTLPASTMIAVCLFLPHAKSCHGRLDTPWSSGTWLVIVPLVLVGALPVAWRAFPRIRRGAPEVVLAFTIIAMAMFVLLIPVAIWLMWGYAKRTFRGELLVAMCSTAVVMMWLCVFPLMMARSDWLPAAELTYGAGVVELGGLLVWTSAAVARPENADEPRSLHAALAR